MKTFVYVGASIDGFIAGENGDLEWLSPFGNEEVLESYKEFISKIDAIVIGRGTFETVLNFPQWPYDKKVFVLSNTLKQLPESVREKATLISRKPRELIEH